MVDELNLAEGRICEDCGQTIPCGLRNSTDHFFACKKNAPNQSIESHRYNVKWDKIHQEEERKLNSIINKLTLEEKLKLFSYQYSGFPIDNGNVIAIAMGKHAFDRLNNYKEQLYKKYLP